MTDPRLFLLEDGPSPRWAPFSQTGPLGELLFGAFRLRRRLEHATGLRCQGYLGAPHLEGLEEEAWEGPLILPPRTHGATPEASGTLILRSLYIPPISALEDTAQLFGMEDGTPTLRLQAGDQDAGWWIRADQVELLEALDDQPGQAAAILEGLETERRQVPGRVLDWPWTLMTHSPAQVIEDLVSLFPRGRGAEGATPLPSLPGVHQLGPHPITAEPEVEVAPGTILDAREGPIHLSRQVRIEPRTHLRGPAFIGPRSTLLGGQISAISCGTQCKLHGEIEHSVILDYCNKAHEGFLGHSILGRWVNLGAMTTNSDLKNTYGSVRITTSSGDQIETGLLKVGVFLGDHVKTGIGTLLNTGTVVGAGSTLFAGDLPPRWVPPFSWGQGKDLTVTHLEPFLTTARRVMGRRNRELTPGMHRLLERLWNDTHGTAQARDEAQGPSGPVTRLDQGEKEKESP